MANRLCIVGVASSCLSLVLCIVGTAIPYWTYIHPTKSFASQFLGLWAQCSDVRGETVCLTYNACKLFVHGHIHVFTHNINVHFKM